MHVGMLSVPFREKELECAQAGKCSITLAVFDPVVIQRINIIVASPCVKTTSSHDAENSTSGNSTSSAQAHLQGKLVGEGGESGGAGGKGGVGGGGDTGGGTWGLGGVIGIDGGRGGRGGLGTGGGGSRGLGGGFGGKGGDGDAGGMGE
eukprot:CAMPEP_0114241178 /NCGR_PEP_ID=MMETSP0058-20121206/9497_1 /TAXON_ID=36894 /ORGANISM="Pyramimonas parkeae, CCMP726" /LENGTH=148 /DNA_ID=CAMNT_0001353693 /DNA_START=325 /DNA_END=769 /DNA_ORIENTATION=-